METIRWGLLSTARINQRLIPAIRLSTRGVLAAVASRDEAKAKSYAQQWEIPLAFGSYQAMLDSGSIDAVYISLPNHLHAEWTIRALNAGVHVLCEKPFAITLDQVDSMIAASQRTGRFLAEAFMYRHHPQTRAAFEWVRSGRLGKISLVRGAFTYATEADDGIYLVPEFGGGCLWDVGCYPLSFAQYLYGEAPQSVFGMQILGKTGVDETFTGQMYYSSSRLAQITASLSSPYFTSLEIFGALGRLQIERPYVELPDGHRLAFYPKKGTPVEIPVPRGSPETDPYRLEVEDLHAAIQDGAPQGVSLAESREHIRTILALYQSARAGQAVKI